MSLSHELEVAREEAQNQAGGAMESLAAGAADLGMAETAENLSRLNNLLQSDTFSFIVIGRFRNGKSTLLNALLGPALAPVPELPQGRGPMPVGELPTTATLTTIRWADKPYARMWRFDGTSEEWPLSRYLAESTVRLDEEENERVFKEIREFELGFPAELCRAGVVLLDSPGTADVAQRTEVTRQALDRCDAAILVLRSDALAGQDEREFADMVQSTGTRTFTIINMRGMETDERFKTFAWNRLVRDQMGGPPYEGQDFADQDIYFVNARAAFEGKVSGNAALVVSSGIAFFEERLANFLVRERQHTHLRKFVRAADVEATAIEQQIAQRYAALDQDEQRLQRAYEEIQPHLEAIRARRDRLPPLFERYRFTTQRQLTQSFDEMVAALRIELPNALEKWPAPSAQGALSLFTQKKACQEVLTGCNDIVSLRLGEWSRGPAQAVLTPVLQGLLEEIGQEVDAIEQQYSEVHFRLSGWQLNVATPTSSVTMIERVLSGATGLVLGDISAVFGVGGGGYRSVAGGLAGQVAALALLSVLGVGGAIVWPAVLAATLASSIVAPSVGMERRIKVRVLEAVQAEIDKMPEQGREALDEGLSREFGTIESGVMQRMLSMIDEEERNIHQIVELNQRGQADKAAARRQLDETATKVMGQRKLLQRALVTGHLLVG